MPLLARFLHPPTRIYRRPPDLAYAAGERPPAMPLAVLALQHAATALALIAYALALARIAGMDTEQTRSLVAATVLSMAVATLLQAWGSHLGSGTLLVHMPDPVLLITGAAIVTAYGPGGLVAAGLVNGLVSLAVSQVMPRLRAVLPPAVAGVVICVAGISLIPLALRHGSGLAEGPSVDMVEVMITGISLAVIVALSVWGGARLKLYALLAGLACGIAVAAAAGRLHGLDTLAGAPLLALPELPAPVLSIEPGMLLAVALLALMTQLDTFGSVVLMHKMEDAEWRRADMRMVAGGIRASALGNLAGAALAAYPTATSSANIALAHISRSTARLVGAAAAAVLLLIAFMPQATLALTLIPTAVIGAVELYAAAYLVVSGIELIASRAMDTRGIFLVGMSFVAGLGVMLTPGLTSGVPEALRFLAQNGIIVAGVTAIGLNLLFRLGSARREALVLDEAGEHPLPMRIVDFVEARGAAWSARRDAVHRAASAALEAAEALQAAGARSLRSLHGSFDEFNLDIELRHEGAPLPIGAAAPAAALTLDSDEATLDAALAGVSGVLLRHLADRVTTGTRGDQAYLRLHFDH